MDLLGTILSGLRAVRAPLASGVLWLAFVIVMTASRHWVVIDNPAIRASLSHIFFSRLTAIDVPLALAAAYLMGILGTGVFNPIIRALGRGISHTVELGYEEIPKRSPRFCRSMAYRISGRLKWSVSTLDYAGRSLAVNSITKSLTKAGVPDWPTFIFPSEMVIELLEYGADKLSQVAPTLYSEYDRLRAESDFRLAITPPLLAIGVGVPFSQRSWLAACAVFGVMVLLRQAMTYHQESYRILANAVDLGFITFPAVDAVVDYIQNLTSQPASNGEWMGVIIEALGRRGYFEESDQAVRSMVGWEEMEEGEVAEARKYLELKAPSSALLYHQLMEKNRGKAKK